MTKTSRNLDIIEPIGSRVLVRKDDERRTTKGGIHLPDDAKIPVISGRVVAISVQVDHDEDYPLQCYDKVLMDPRNSIPVDFEQDNKLHIVPVEDIVAVFRRNEATDDAASDDAASDDVASDDDAKSDDD
jgi:chaperonin GroES